MILEIADFAIHPGQNAAFEEAIQRGVRTVIAHAKGFEGFKVNRCIENPQRYVLQIFWTTLEDHTVGFRESSRVHRMARHRRAIFCQCTRRPAL
jgi:heme-degrading monooxygenase HmoA